MLRDWTDSLPLDGISAEAERLFVRLIMKADDYGRYHAEPRLVKSLCFPLFDGMKTELVARALDELSQRSLIFRYEVENQRLLSIINFGQRLRETRAKFPQPAGEPANWLPVAAICGNLPQGAARARAETEEKGSEDEVEEEDEGKGSGGTTPPERGAASGAQKPPRRRSAPLPDSDWLASLKTNPGFAGIDIDREFGKARAWCETKHRPLSRARFVAWLNRVEQPINAAASKPKLVSRPWDQGAQAS